MPLISVVIPTHNRADMLDEALRSVLAQSCRDFEVIVVDDGSIDHTRDVVGRYPERVRYLYQESRGCSCARNAAIQLSRGAYVAFLDDDDVWYPHKLELQSMILTDRADVDLVYGPARLVTGRERRLLSRRPPDPGTLLEQLISSTWMIPAGASVVMVRKDTLQRSGLFDPSVWPFDDWDLWTRIALHGGRFAWVDQPVAEYRMHQSNAVHDKRGMQASYIAVLEKALAAPECPLPIKARREHYLSRRWVRVGNDRYVDLELGGAWAAWREALGLDLSVLTPQLVFLMVKSVLGSRVLGWGRQTKRALVGASPC